MTDQKKHDVAGLVERINAAQEWMRLPDHAERFSFADLTDWLNERPTSVLPEAASTITAQAQEIERLREALEKPFAVVFLDGRNEHGTHVLPSFPTGIDPEDVTREMKAGTAELVMAEAERLGFNAGDHVWTNWLFYRGEPWDGNPSAIEFVGIDVELSTWLRDRARELTEKNDG